MKTVRILLYPDEKQIGIMDTLCDVYSVFLTNKILEKQWDIPLEDMPKELCQTSNVQLLRDVHRRLRRSSLSKLRFPHRYCRWGEDYRLYDTQLVLLLGNGLETSELIIDCIFRPFQEKLLASKHPETLTLKNIKHHWYAYLLVSGDI